MILLKNSLALPVFRQLQTDFFQTWYDYKDS